MDGEDIGIQGNEGAAEREGQRVAGQAKISDLHSSGWELRARPGRC